MRPARERCQCRYTASPDQGSAELPLRDAGVISTHYTNLKGIQTNEQQNIPQYT